MDLFQLAATLTLETGEFERGVNRSRGLFSSLGSTVSAGTVAMGHLMADAMKKAGQMVVDFGRTGISYNAQMQDYTASFKTMLGSTEAAAEKVEALKKFAAATPFEMTDLAQATQTLLAFGIEAEKTDGIMKMLGDVSLGNSQKFSSLATVFGQVSSTGKLMGQDLLQFINQGFNPLQVIAEKTGASMSDLKKVMSGEKTSRDFQEMIKAAQTEVKKMGDEASESAKLLAQIGTDGAISAEMVEEAFRIATSEGGQFYNGMEENSKTLNGLFSTLSDNWTSLVGDVFKPASDFLQTTLLPLAIEGVDKLSQAYNENGLKGMLSAAADLIAPYVSKAFSALSNIADNAVTMGANILAGVYNGLTGGEITAEDVKLVFSGIADEAGKTFDAFVAAGGTVLSSVYELLTGDSEGAQGIKDTINGVFEDPMGTLKTLATGAGAFFTDVYNALMGDSAAMESVKETITGAFSTVGEFIDKVKANAGTIFTDVLTALGADAQAQEEIKAAFSAVFGAASDMVSTLIATAGGMLGTIRDAILGDESAEAEITAAFSAVFTRPAVMIQGIIDKGKSILETITGAFTDEEKRKALLEAIHGAFSQGVAYIASLPGLALEWGKNLIDNFIQGLVDKWNELKWKVIDLVGSIKSYFSGTSITIGTSGATGSFAVGLDYVPRDNFPANLHRGEAVLTRSEAEEWRAGAGGRGTTINVYQSIYSEAKTAAELMREARWEQEKGVMMGYVYG